MENEIYVFETDDGEKIYMEVKAQPTKSGKVSVSNKEKKTYSSG